METTLKKSPTPPQSNTPPCGTVRCSHKVLQSDLIPLVSPQRGGVLNPPLESIPAKLYVLDACIYFPSCILISVVLSMFGMIGEPGQSGFQALVRGLGMFFSPATLIYMALLVVLVTITTRRTYGTLASYDGSEESIKLCNKRANGLITLNVAVAILN